ncbi:hypothetical protein [Fulvivirga maritima]|nr:hypothetical protein [Fulvivirga maritima]
MDIKYIGDGADLFITIVACLAGFGAALGLLDSLKSKKKNNSEEA